MQFALGALITAAFFCCLSIGYILGQRSKQPKPMDLHLMDDEDFEIEEQREKAKAIKKGFDEMMSYNEAKARKG